MKIKLKILSFLLILISLSMTLSGNAIIMTPNVTVNSYSVSQNGVKGIQQIIISLKLVNSGQLGTNYNINGIQIIAKDYLDYYYSTQLSFYLSLNIAGYIYPAFDGIPYIKYVSISLPLSIFQATKTNTDPTLRYYALNAGTFYINSVYLNWNNVNHVYSLAEGSTAPDFHVSNSNKVFTAVVYDNNYLSITNPPSGTTISNLLNRDTFQRQSKVHTLSIDSYYNSYSVYNSGFESIAGVDFDFVTFGTTLNFDNGNCNSIVTAAYPFLKFYWSFLTTSGVSGTSVKNQGLDLLIILTNNVQQNKGVLGVTCGGDSFFGNPIPNDYPRSMAIVLHESSHIFRNTGTHCSDSPYYLQGYELCAEELNSQYKPVLGGWNIFLSYIDKVCNTAYCTYYPDPIWTITNLHNRFGIPYA